jgi:hypothetical protein
VERRNHYSLTNCPERGGRGRSNLVELLAFLCVPLQVYCEREGKGERREGAREGGDEWTHIMITSAPQPLNASLSTAERRH